MKLYRPPQSPLDRLGQWLLDTALVLFVSGLVLALVMGAARVALGVCYVDEHGNRVCVSGPAWINGQPQWSAPAALPRASSVMNPSAPAASAQGAGSSGQGAGFGYHAQVVSADRDGRLSMGSGTLVWCDEQLGHVVTNAHVIRDSNGTVTVELGGRRYGARIGLFDGVNDLAQLVIQRPHVAPVRIDDSTPTGPLRLCGFGGPRGFREVWGRIVNWPTPDGARYPCAEISARVRDGDSGGGAFNADGYFCGVVWGSGNGSGTMVTCGQPLRDFLGRIFAGRSVPQYGWRSGGSHGGTPPAPPTYQPPPAAPPQQQPVVGDDPARYAAGCACNRQWQALIAWQQDVTARLAAIETRAPAAPDVAALAAEVQRRLPPFQIRVADPRGPNYSTEFQPVYLGDRVTLPFGPAQ